MPSLSFIKRNYGAPTVGLVHKQQSDMVMEATWWNDISSQTAFLYDWYHDDHKQQLNDLDPWHDDKKIPIDIKYLKNSSQTYEKDSVSFHLQMKPSQICNVPYYDEYFKDRYGAEFPVGLYIDIADSKGKYNRWLVVGLANSNDFQFPTYELLRCDYVIQYIMDGIKYNIPSVLRSQNSYNSGVWLDYRVESPEDVQKFCCPINRDTERIWDNLRTIIDANVLTEPRCWVVTKINRLQARGCVTITLAQDRYDQHKDYIELDPKTGNVIGKWADYYSSVIEPVEIETTIPVSSIRSEITYTGVKPEIKVGANKKTFTVTFYDRDDVIPFRSGTWSILLDGINIKSNTSLIDFTESGEQLKFKFLGDKTYIGQILTVQFESYDGVKSFVEMEIKAL